MKDEDFHFKCKNPDCTRCNPLLLPKEDVAEFVEKLHEQFPDVEIHIIKEEDFNELKEPPEVPNYPEPATYFEPSSSEGLHNDVGKTRVDLVSPEAIIAIAEVMGFGCAKYAPRNWEKGINFTRLYGSALRHQIEWSARRDNDPESGLNHLKHALWNLAAIITYIERGMDEFDDRPEVGFFGHGHAKEPKED